MNILFSIIIGLNWIIVAAKIFDLTYLFQIKEYRRDRLLAFLKEKGIGKNLYFNNDWRLPKKSFRNLIIVIFSLAIIFTLIVFSLRLQIIYQPIIVWFSFMLTPLIIGLATAITAPLASFSRRLTIAKAKKIIHGSKATFIGITGSYAKTSVKEFLYQILKEKYRVEQTEKNYNSEIGVALSIIKNLKKQTRFFIVEMGAYKRGEIRKICRLTPPRYGIITAISNQHQALFGSRKKLIEAKGELASALPKNGRLYISPQIKSLLLLTKLSQAPLQTNIYLKKVRVSNQGSQAIAVYQNKRVSISTHLLGKHNLINLLTPIALSLDLGLTTKEIEKAIRKINPLPGKLSFHQGPNKSLILNDAVNSNQQGFIAALKTAALFPKKSLVVISKGITELGTEKKTAYRLIIKNLQQTKGVLYTNDLFFKKLVPKNNQIIVFNNEKKLYNKLIKKLNSRTLLLIEGKFTKNFLKKLIV